MQSWVSALSLALVLLCAGALCDSDGAQGPEELLSVEGGAEMCPCPNMKIARCCAHASTNEHEFCCWRRGCALLFVILSMRRQPICCAGVLDSSVHRTPSKATNVGCSVAGLFGELVSPVDLGSGAGKSQPPAVGGKSAFPHDTRFRVVPERCAHSAHADPFAGDQQQPETRDLAARGFTRVVTAVPLFPPIQLQP